MKLYLPLCQCPSTGLSHFYYPELEIVFDAPKCVNALLRAYPISTRSRTERIYGSINVSMPFYGLIPFLRIF